MRDRDSIILESMYEKILVLEFSESAIKKLIAKFKDTQENNVRDYLERFERVKGQLDKKDPFQYKTFQELEVAVDAVDRSGGSKEHVASNKDDLKVYEDENVIVYKAKNQKDTTTLGDNGYYSFCISRPSGGNLYSGYRLRAASTFYFVRFKDKSSDKDNKGIFVDPSHYIVIDAQENNRLQWTWADNGSQGHGTTDTTKKEIGSSFPALEKPFNEGVFQNDPITKEEKDKLKKFDKLDNRFNSDDFNTLTYKEKEEYIRTGFRIDDIKILDKNLKNEYLGIGHDISEEEFKSLTDSERKRWMHVKKQILDSVGGNILCYIKNLISVGIKVESRYMDYIKRHNTYSIYIIKFLIDKGLDVDPELIDATIKAGESLELAEFLIDRGLQIYPIVLDDIAPYLKKCYEFAGYLIYKGHKKIDQIFLERISESPEYSYSIATDLINKNLEVDPLLLDGISKDIDFSFRFATRLTRAGHKVDQIILDKIKTDPEWSFDFSLFLKKHPNNKLTPEQRAMFINEEPVKTESFKSFFYRKLL